MSKKEAFNLTWAYSSKYVKSPYDSKSENRDLSKANARYSIATSVSEGLATGIGNMTIDLHSQIFSEIVRQEGSNLYGNR